MFARAASRKAVGRGATVTAVALAALGVEAATVWDVASPPQIPGVALTAQRAALGVPPAEPLLVLTAQVMPGDSSEASNADRADRPVRSERVAANESSRPRTVAPPLFGNEKPEPPSVKSGAVDVLLLALACLGCALRYCS